jgi:hypothetical protein
MTHAELSRRRALNSVEIFLSALNEYKQREHDPRDRHIFAKGDGISRIENNPDLPSGLVADLTRLRDSLAARRADDVVNLLHRLVAADYALPFDVNTNYRAHYLELFERSRDYAETSQLDPSGAPTSDEPRWKGLKIKKQAHGNDIAILDGESFRLLSGAAPFLERLQSAEGDFVLASTLTSDCGRRADYIFKTLDPALQSIVDRPGKRRQGYRML